MDIFDHDAFHLEDEELLAELNIVIPDEFLPTLCLIDILHWDPARLARRKEKTNMDHFTSSFGCRPVVCSQIFPFKLYR